MPDAVFSALLFACVMSVPLAAFAVAALYRRAGFGFGWTITLHIIGGAAVLADIAFFGGFGVADGNVPSGITVIFAAAVLVTSAALALAFRPWPVQANE